MRRALAFASAGLLVLAACGGSDKTTGPGNLAHGTMTATISGSGNFSATSAISATYSNGILAVGGSNLTSSIAFAAFVSGPSTVTSASPGFANGNYIVGSAGWAAALGTPGGSVSITVTSLSSTGAAGTFNFTLPASAGTTATGTKTITGAFNVTF